MSRQIRTTAATNPTNVLRSRSYFFDSESPNRRPCIVQGSQLTSACWSERSCSIHQPQAVCCSELSAASDCSVAGRTSYFSFAVRQGLVTIFLSSCQAFQSAPPGPYGPGGLRNIRFYFSDASDASDFFLRSVSAGINTVRPAACGVAIASHPLLQHEPIPPRLRANVSHAPRAITIIHTRIRARTMRFCRRIGMAHLGWASRPRVPPLICWRAGRPPSGFRRSAAQPLGMRSAPRRTRGRSCTRVGTAATASRRFRGRRSRWC